MSGSGSIVFAFQVHLGAILRRTGRRHVRRVRPP
jgi:hypothetical protein